jgi:DNA-binding transcriptional regulator YiaG
MKEDTRIAVIELHLLKETIREVIREELGKQAVPSSEEVTYKETDRLSISQVAKYLGVSTKTVNNYRKEHKIPEPEYNLSGKPRWTVAKLQSAVNALKSKQRLPVA